jgi:hypothetical protein
VTSSAEQYRQLARNFHFMALSLPPGEHRAALLNTAKEWERLADQQEQATDPRQERSYGRRFCLPAGSDRRGLPALCKDANSNSAAAHYSRRAIKSGVVQRTRRALTCYSHSNERNRKPGS